jgi:hypothetical protein
VVTVTLLNGVSTTKIINRGENAGLNLKIASCCIHNTASIEASIEADCPCLFCAITHCQQKHSAIGGVMRWLRLLLKHHLNISLEYSSGATCRHLRISLVARKFPLDWYALIKAWLALQLLLWPWTLNDWT